MKKLIVVLCLLLVAGVAMADTVDLKLPKSLKVKDGAIYSLKNNKTENVTTGTIYEYKLPVGSIDLDAGYAIENEPILALCYTTPNLKEMGIELPYGEYISVSGGGFLGLEMNEYQDNGNNFIDALDYGLYAVGQLKVKF